ncbi:uncharacterized transporter YutK isoform X2 [Lepeophtheirus salmonis]|nr:solute carrier family 28 member 3-like isoform X2 [Lepeophtheirus salmonis]
MEPTIQDTTGKDNPSFEIGPFDTEEEYNNQVKSRDENDEEDEEDDIFENLEPLSGIPYKIEYIRQSLTSRCKGQNKKTTHKNSLMIVLALVVNAFFIWTLATYFTQEENGIDWCNGVGLLILILIGIYSGLGYYKFIKPYIILNTFVQKSFNEVYAWYSEIKWLPAVVNAIVIICLLIFVVVDSWEDQGRLISFFGIFVLVFLGFIFSKHPGRVEWRQVIMGLIIQFLLGLLILRWDFGRNVFDCSSKKVKQFLDFTDQGSSFVYGYLVSGKPLNTDGIKNETFLEELNRINDRFGPVLLFKALSVIYFFSFFVSMLFYVGVMQKIVSQIGWVLQISMGTTACESMNAAANIFLGQSEAPLIIKPYLHMMTKSEIHAVMAGGFATIAGSVLAAFIIFGVDATHLLSASIMSAPAALASAKLLYPESKKSKTEANSLMDNFKVKGEATNLLDAATQGAITAVQLVMNICACLIAFLAFIGLLNSLLSWGGNLVGYSDITFEFLLGKLFIPLAWILGCDNKDLHEVGELIGIKSFLTEFVAFQKLGISHTLSRRSRIIATYALCGFANPASMGIQVACLSTMAPTRRRTITNVAIRAYFSGSLACFLTACVAGSLIA